jgi:hypothetical protein
MRISDDRWDIINIFILNVILVGLDFRLRIDLDSSVDARHLERLRYQLETVRDLDRRVRMISARVAYTFRIESRPKSCTHDRFEFSELETFRTRDTSAFVRIVETRIVQGRIFF